MKKLAAVLAVLVGGSIPYVIAQQSIEVPVLVPPAPAALVATDHPPLPKDISQYWFVPAPGSAAGASREAYASLARGAKSIANGQYAAGLALLSRRDLAETRLADYAKYYQAMALQGLSRFAEADAVLTPLAANVRDGALKDTVRLKLAEVLIARSDLERAEQFLRTITSDSKGASEDFWMLLGQAEEAIDHRDHAIEAYRKVYYSFPLSGRVGDAKTGLDRLHVTVGAAGSVSDEFARAERLFAGRRWAEARVALEPLLPLVSTEDRGRVTLHLAECDYHLGRHKAARDRLKTYLDDAPKDAEARYYSLSAARGMGDRSTYVSLSRALVKEFPDSQWAAETLDDLASYYIIDDQDDEADEVFRELLDRFPRHRYAERATWKVGWEAYRRQKFGETIKLFEWAAATFPRADYRPGWIYWSGRARDRMGDTPGATARYRLAVADYGNSYYGRLASRLLASRPQEQAAAGAAPRPVAAPAQVAAAPPTESLMRALMAAGLYDDALREVQYAQRTWSDSPALQATSAWIRAQQAQELRAEERFAALRGSITLMRRAYPQFLAEEGHTLPLEVLHIIFPLDYWDLIEKYSKAMSLDPYLVSALMAQESTFTAEIRSSANARGLMQVMPSTGRMYARRMGIRPFTTASLSQPETNVRIGMQHFKDLADKFGGIHYALASYNAGEGRVSEWLKEYPDLPADEFIDSIPFAETQNYVKRILGTAEDYRRLYGTGLLTPNGRPAAAR
jgi:soluble lytic murein transglycosylase